MTTITPNPPLPAGTHTLSDWKDWDYLYRLLWGDMRLVEATNIGLSTTAAQLPDGSIDDGTVAEEPAVIIDEFRDGKRWDCLTVTVQGARNLATSLIAAADEIDGWSAR
jgi:hypothetical protein